MRVVVIGSSGQLGVDLMAALHAARHEAIGYAGRAELDITKPEAVDAALSKCSPDAVINTAAFHHVDLCEQQPVDAYATNVLAVKHLAQQCEKRGILFMQIGTDYVMEGSPKDQPLPEDAPVAPASIYAVTRFGGDRMTLAHAPTTGYVVRTCGLFGVAGCKLKGGQNFVDTMVAGAKAGKRLRVVSDQIVAPTPTDDLAAQLALILDKQPGPGLYHAVAHGQCSWYEFAKRALELAGVPHFIEPVASITYDAPAKRPAYSVLDNRRLRSLGLDRMGPWETGLVRFIAKKYGLKE
jgi:dTDP-4-dehydrorhamnose reductase